jgi:hypothetical protein
MFDINTKNKKAQLENFRAGLGPSRGPEKILLTVLFLNFI